MPNSVCRRPITVPVWGKGRLEVNTLEEAKTRFDSIVIHQQVQLFFNGISCMVTPRGSLDSTYFSANSKKRTVTFVPVTNAKHQSP